MKLKISLALSGILVIAGCGGSDDATPPDTVTLPTPTTSPDPVTTITDSSAYNDQGVHDPSIIKVEGDGSTTADTWYVFGSHLAAAKTTNLQTWEMFSSLTANHLVDESPLFNTYTTEIAEGIAWTDGYTGSWAPDVIQAPNGEYWFYYSHCAQNVLDVETCQHRSYLGLAKSSTVEGPYVNEGILVRSGHRDETEIANYPIGEGVTSYNPEIHPNAIDPAAFYDKDGDMWLVYGSYSGGLFILALDETTGLAEPGQGFGTHLVGGNFSAMEGAFVIYSSESDYYYLFWSNGGFNAADGYNIRVARSRNPDGPYVDAEGNDMVNARVANDMGVKLMGGYNFVSAIGDASEEWGYRSPGHNSAMYDADLDKYLLFTHTRFPRDQVPFEQNHAVRVHEMWVNEDGWLVASPHRYAPISDGESDALDVVGDYRVVLHGKDTNRQVHESIYISLTSQGRFITGELTGWYKLYQDDPERITLTLDGVVYEGVTKWQWNVEHERLEPVISALSADGSALWAQQLEEKSRAEVVADIQAALQDFATNTIPDFVKSDAIPLPTLGARGAQLVWTSNNTHFVENDGSLTRPNILDGDQTINLGVEIYFGDEMVASNDFDILVPARVKNNLIAHYMFEGELSESFARFTDGVPAANVSGTAASPVFTAGTTGQAVNIDGTYGILLPTNLIQAYEYTVSFWLNEQASAAFRPAFFAGHSPDPARWVSFLPTSWNGELMVWAHWYEDGANWFDAFSGTVVPDNEWHHVAFAVDHGFVQIYYDGQLMGTGNNLRDLFTGKPEGSILTLGLNYWDPAPSMYIDEFKIYEAPLSARQLDALEVNTLPETEFMQIAYDELSLGDLTEVISDLDLPNSGAFAASISWVSSNEDVISSSGEVTRPARGTPNAEVTLTATITLGEDTMTKEFVANTLAITPPLAVARYSFDGDLTDSEGNFAEGHPVAPGIVDTTAEMVYGEGIVGQAVSFAGAATHGAKLGNDLITDHTYGFGLWLNPNSTTVYTTTFFGYRDASAWISVVPQNPGGQTLLWSGNAVWYDALTGTGIPTGEWTHFAVSVSQGNIEIWLNGVSVFVGSNFPDIFSTANPAQFAIGTNLFTQDATYNGLMDELVIYGDPITQEEVDALYAEGQE